MRRRLVAGPGQTIAAAPISLDLEAVAYNLQLGNPEGVTDGLVGWWLYEEATPGQYTIPTEGECPFCFRPLKRPHKRPGGRVAYKITGAIAAPGTVEFMIDLLPDQLDLVGCGICGVAFTRPFKETTD